MARHVAFLGAINVGGNQLKMADLKAALEDEGFAGVGTVVASGNVLFDHEATAAAADVALAGRIATIVKDRFGIDSFAVVRTAGEVEAALAENPFHGSGEDKLVHTHFLTGQPTAEQFAALFADHEGRGCERLAAGDRALHIDFVDGAGSSKLTAAFMARRLGHRGTARNMRSLKRILEKMGE